LGAVSVCRISYPNRRSPDTDNHPEITPYALPKSEIRHLGTRVLQRDVADVVLSGLPNFRNEFYRLRIRTQAENGRIQKWVVKCFERVATKIEK